MAANLPGGALAKSTLWELGLIAIAGLMYGLLILPLLFPEFTLLTSAVLFLGVAFGGFYLLKKAINTLVAAAFCLQMVFLAVSGAIFVALSGILVSTTELGMGTWLPLGGAYVVAWLAGLITPGAPAGVGVREMALLILAKGILAESDLLMIILVGRIVTVVGDFLFFMFSVTIIKMSRL